MNGRRRSRFLALAVLSASWLGANVVGASSALAAHRSDGDDPGPQLAPLKAVLFFGVIPVSATLVIALVVSLPTLVSGPRYRPGRNWQGTPEWYGAPAAEVESADGDPATPSDEFAPSRRGAVTGTIVATDEGHGGGSSARW